MQDFQLDSAIANRTALDRIALEQNGVVCHATGSEYNKKPSRIDDWDFQWVNTRGTRNGGTLILLPKSKRAYAIRQDGKARFLQEKGFGFMEAKALAASKVAYLFEERVLECLLYLCADAHYRDLVEVATGRLYTRRELSNLQVNGETGKMLAEMSADRRSSVQKFAKIILSVN